MADEKSYRLEKADDKLIFRTASFRPERGSILHSGIFTRELASSFASGGLVIALLIIALFSGVRLRLMHIAALMLIFAGALIVFRFTLLKEESLDVIFDKKGGVLTVSLRKLPIKRHSYPIADLKDIVKGHVVFKPENPDGIRVVEKVALQHGTVIPGFGEAKEFYTVELAFRDANRLAIFSGSAYDAGLIEKLIKDYLFA